jgi:hypothetical protein
MTHEELYRVRQILRVDGFGGGEPLVHVNVVKDRPLYTWPSGIDAVDKLSGGFYDLTVVAGGYKLGKSLLALRSALEAAENGWTVLYLDGENDPGTLGRRIVNYFGCDFTRWPDWYVERFILRRFGPQATIEGVAVFAAGRITEADDKVLIVIDSANRLAKRVSSNQKTPYFEALGGIVDWGQNVACLSRGTVGVLLVSELNRRGQATGLDVEYSASALLYLRGDPTEPEVELQLLSRRTLGGHLGTHRRIYSRCAFGPVSESCVGREWWRKGD